MSKAKITLAIVAALAVTAFLIPAAASATPTLSKARWTQGGTPIPDGIGNAVSITTSGSLTLTVTIAGNVIAVTCNVSDSGSIWNDATDGGKNSESVTYSGCSATINGSPSGCTVSAVENNNPVPTTLGWDNANGVYRDKLTADVTNTFSGCVLAFLGPERFTGDLYPQVDPATQTLVFDSSDPDQGTLSGPFGTHAAVDGSDAITAPTNIGVTNP